MATSQELISSLSTNSSYVENVLTHHLIAELSSELWQRGKRLAIFNAEVDDAGFDLVLGCEQQLRYVQIKQKHSEGKAASFSVRLDFSKLPGSCVVVIVYDRAQLRIKNFLFYGGIASDPMPSVETFPSSKLPGRVDSAGMKRLRPHYRDISRREFTSVTAPQLVDLLFDKVILEGRTILLDAER